MRFRLTALNLQLNIDIATSSHVHIMPAMLELGSLTQRSHRQCSYQPGHAPPLLRRSLGQSTRANMAATAEETWKVEGPPGGATDPVDPSDPPGGASSTPHTSASSPRWDPRLKASGWSCCARTMACAHASMVSELYVAPQGLWTGSGFHVAGVAADMVNMQLWLLRGVQLQLSSPESGSYSQTGSRLGLSCSLALGPGPAGSALP